MVNPNNKLFVFSIILVPILLVSMSYESIRDFYTYSVPLNSLKISQRAYGLHQFDIVKNKEDSTCFTTPSQNYFCYTKPRMYQNGGVSYIEGSNGVGGELHFDQVGVGLFYFTIKNMTRINGDDAIITLADKAYRIGNETSTKYQISDRFEYSTKIKKFDSFISNCWNNEGTDVSIVQYLGVKSINGTDYFLTWHTIAHSDKGVSCKYPQVISHSFGHNFGDL